MSEEETVAKSEVLSNYDWNEGEKISRLLSKAANGFFKLTSFGHNSLETPKNTLRDFPKEQ